MPVTVTPHGHGEAIVSESDFIEKTEGAQLLFI